MITLLFEKLNLQSFSPETPLYNEYAQKIYQQIIQDDFTVIRNHLPEQFTDFRVILETDMLTDEPPDIRSTISPETPFLTLSDLLIIAPEIMTAMEENQKSIHIFLYLMMQFKVHFLTVCSLMNKEITYSKEDIQRFLDKKIQFSQSAIASEWEIDNDTLSKWFVAYYGENIFMKRKKLKLSEYLDVWRDMFVLKEHKESSDTPFMIENRLIDFYSSQIMKGKTYLKRDIIEEGFNLTEDLQPRHYDEALKILSPKFSYYSSLNKFPTTMAFDLINELKKHT